MVGRDDDEVMRAVRSGGYWGGVLEGTAGIIGGGRGPVGAVKDLMSCRLYGSIVNVKSVVKAYLEELPLQLSLPPIRNVQHMSKGFIIASVG